MNMLKKSAMILSFVFVMLLSSVFGCSLMYVMAEEEGTSHPDRYYTSIHIENGDTLWSIAEAYRNPEESVIDYVRELRQINSLSDDHIDTGHYLTVRYYR